MAKMQMDKDALESTLASGSATTPWATSSAGHILAQGSPTQAFLTGYDGAGSAYTVDDPRRMEEVVGESFSKSAQPPEYQDELESTLASGSATTSWATSSAGHILARCSPTQAFFNGYDGASSAYTVDDLTRMEEVDEELFSKAAAQWVYKGAPEFYPAHTLKGQHHEDFMLGYRGRPALHSDSAMPFATTTVPVFDAPATVSASQPPRWPREMTDPLTREIVQKYDAGSRGGRSARRGRPKRGGRGKKKRLLQPEKKNNVDAAGDGLTTITEHDGLTTITEHELH